MNFLIKFLIRIPILKRIIPSIYKRYVFFTKNYNKEIKIKNVIYDLDLRHLIDRRFFFFHGYEDELFLPLKKIIHKYNISCFLDIGSCWGLYSLRLAGCFKHLKIFSFDPIKKNISRLTNSIKKNNFTNIKCYHTAIGSKKGIVSLGATEDYSPNYEINNYNSVINESSELNYLDDLLKMQNKYIALKIDTEGFELEVLNGAKTLLKNNKCFCQIEIKEDNFNDIMIFFKNLNYDLISINKKNKTDFLFSNFINKSIEI